jgi:hypothetical protein
MTWVPGEPLDHATISRGTHAADTLAGFLQALHVEAPAEAPIATDCGAHPRNCTDGFENFFRAVAPDDIAADVRAVWDDAVGAPRGRACRFGCTATFIPRTPSSRTERSRASSTSVACSPAIRRARGLAAMKSLFLMLMGQNGDRGLPGGKPNWGPAGRAALDRVLKGV